MNKQQYIIITPKYIFCVLVLIISSYSSFSQNPSNADSSKIKKQSTPSSDTSVKYGYAKITLLGHTRIVKLPPLQDFDGDGVPDQLDLEPNTPHGAEVDSHGRALDTDDKEKLTQQSCFPVDSNGVGVCPALAIKQEKNDNDTMMLCCATPVCHLDSLPSIVFEKDSVKITRGIAQILVNCSLELMSNPYCSVRVRISTHGSKRMLKLQKMRAEAIIKYFIEKTGYLENHIKLDYDNAADSNNAANSDNIIRLQPCLCL